MWLQRSSNFSMYSWHQQSSNFSMYSSQDISGQHLDNERFYFFSRVYFYGDFLHHVHQLTMDDSAKIKIDVSDSVSFLAQFMAFHPQHCMFLQDQSNFFLKNSLNPCHGSMESNQDNLEDMKIETALKIIQRKHGKIKKYIVGLKVVFEVYTSRRFYLLNIQFSSFC